MSSRHLSAATLLASVLVLTGCGGGTDAAAPPGAGGASAAASQANAADVGFLTGMTPHHEQAVQMSDLVLAADPPAAVAAIARRIKAAQEPELQRMAAMLAALEDADGGHGGGHGGSHGGGGHGAGGGMAAHGGMMSAGDLAALGAATGAEAARLYLEAMIEHHRGAVAAAETELADGVHEPARALARSIAQEQAAEIATMQALLRDL